MNANLTKRILICPLDWGLGHATRCIPVVNEFLKQGCHVFIASSGQALNLLKNEFPPLVFEELPAYNPHYSSTWPMTFSMALQLPKFINTIREEHKQLEKIIEARKIDIVISDNRYGCWSSQVKSIFITHQVNIVVPWLLNTMVQNFNRKSMAKFSICWVPDYEGEHALAGKLSQTLGENVRFIGLLSRFKKRDDVKTRYDILAIVSGPEPQRQVFENRLRGALIKSKKKALLVKGIPSDSKIKRGEIDEVDFLKAAELNVMIQSSDVIICRSGYSTIMDLVTLGKKAILIPTPGQTEQEYLAERLKSKGMMYSVNQKEFDLPKALKEMESYKNEIKNDTGIELSTAIEEILNK